MDWAMVQGVGTVSAVAYALMADSRRARREALGQARQVIIHGQPGGEISFQGRKVRWKVTISNFSSHALRAVRITAMWPTGCIALPTAGDGWEAILVDNLAVVPMHHLRPGTEDGEVHFLAAPSGDEVPRPEVTVDWEDQNGLRWRSDLYLPAHRVRRRPWGIGYP